MFVLSGRLYSSNERPPTNREERFDDVTHHVGKRLNFLLSVAVLPEIDKPSKASKVPCPDPLHLHPLR